MSQEQVIRLLRRSKTSLSISEISRKIKLNKESIARACKKMVYWKEISVEKRKVQTENGIHYINYYSIDKTIEELV